MTDRRKFAGKDRRRRGERFPVAEEIRRNRELAKTKLEEYEMGAGVPIISFVVHAAAIICMIIAAVAWYFEKETFVWVSIAGTVFVIVFGEKWIRSAKKKAREQFEKDPNKHLLEYLPS